MCVCVCFGLWLVSVWLLLVVVNGGEEGELQGNWVHSYVASSKAPPSTICTTQDPFQEILVLQLNNWSSKSPCCLDLSLWLSISLFLLLCLSCLIVQLHHHFSLSFHPESVRMWTGTSLDFLSHTLSHTPGIVACFCFLFYLHFQHLVVMFWWQHRCMQSWRNVFLTQQWSC